MAKGMIFALENLKLLDLGKVSAAFDAEVRRVVSDCTDRPADDHARVVTIKFTFVPVPESGGGTIECEHVQVECSVTGKIPDRKTKCYEMSPRHDGKLLFNPDLPEEPDEETLYDGDERRQDAGK